MKIRNGFVSNSSSSSFVIRADGELSTVKDVAKYIIDQCDDNEHFVKEINALKELKDSDTPVHFNTWGDQTYIRKHGSGVIMITTTQNVDFGSLDNNCLNDSDLSEDFYNEFHQKDEEYPEDSYTPEDIEDLKYFYTHFDDFFILREGIYGRYIYMRNCPMCNENFTRGYKLKNGKEICMCQIDKYIRKEKLIKINES